jgi:hypothetical protein
MSYRRSPYTGRLVRRNRDGSRAVIASALNFPIGMAASHSDRYGRALYLSMVSHGQGPIEGLGRIVRGSLRDEGDD